MALIKCPQCGQTVMSIASVCPKCSFLLLQSQTPGGSDRDHASCRRCGKIILRDAAICEFCDYPQLARRRLRRVGGLVLALGTVAGAIIGVRAMTSAEDTPPPSQAEAAAPTRTAAAPAAPVPSAAPIVAQPRAAATVEPDARDTMITSSPAATVRWTREWANVREGRGIQFPIVGVLRPGERVLVSELRSGWWAVQLEGVEIGYVARDLLANEPPVR